MFNGNNLHVSGDSGFPALIGVIGSNDALSGGSTGNDTIWSIGNSVSVTDTTSHNLFGVIGNNDTLSGGPSGDTLWAIGDGDIVKGGPSGGNLIGVVGNNDSVTGGAGNDTVYVSGTGDTVGSGTGKTTIGWTGSNHTFADNGGSYQDTIVGFDHAGGDSIKLGGTDTAAYAVAHQQNSGGDTLVTLNDGSTILLKGVTSVGTGFFH